LWTSLWPFIHCIGYNYFVPLKRKTRREIYFYGMRVTFFIWQKSQCYGVGGSDETVEPLHEDERQEGSFERAKVGSPPAIVSSESTPPAKYSTEANLEQDQPRTLITATSARPTSTSPASANASFWQRFRLKSCTAAGEDEASSLDNVGTKR
jgi:hypothetical protein